MTSINLKSKVIFLEVFLTPLRFFQRTRNRYSLSKKLALESHMVSENSMRVLAEFESLEDEIL